MRLRLLLAVLALGWATPAVAGVARVMIVVVAQDEATQGLALTTQSSAAAMLAHDDRLEVVDPAARYAPEGAAATEKQVIAARAALEDIGRLLADVDYEGARGKAELALTALRGADFRAVRDLYVQLLMQLARIKQALHADDSGLTELAQAFAVDSEAAPLRGINSAERKAFDTAKVQAAAAPRAAAVRIEGEQLGWVWIDGRFRGVTPVTVNDLSAGRHFVTFAAPGGTTTAQTELFGSITKLSVAAPVSPEGRTFRALVASLEAGMKRQQPGTAARELLTWAKVEEVIAVGISTQGPTSLVRVGAAGLARSEVKDKTTEALVAAIRGLLDEPLRSDAVANTPTPAAVSAARPEVVQVNAARSTLPGWVLIGAGAVAAGVGTAMLVAGQSQYNDAGKIPQVEKDKYASAVSSANGVAAGGIGAVGVGVVAVGLGVYFVW